MYARFQERIRETKRDLKDWLEKIKIFMQVPIKDKRN